MMASPGKNAE